MTSESTLAESDLLPAKPPRRENKVYTYIHVGFGKTDIRSGRPATPSCDIQGFYELYDRYEDDPDKRLKVVKLASKERSPQKDGKIKTEERVKTIEMPKGILRVHADKDYLLHRFLWCHPGFADGPYYDNAKPPIFRLLKEASDAARRPTLREMELEQMAFRSATRLSNAEVKVMADRLHGDYPDLVGAPAGRQPSAVREEVAYFAKSNPDAYFRLTPDPVAKLRYAINISIESGLIRFDEDKREWRMGTKNQKLAGVAHGESPEDRLLLYLSPQEKDKDAKPRLAAQRAVLLAGEFELDGPASDDDNPEDPQVQDQEEEPI